MPQIIRIKNATYERYEELLLKKERLLKEAEGYRIAYERTFGVLNSETYEAKIECVKKRKIVSYCQNMIEIGSTIVKKELDEFVDKSMQDYKDTLSYLFANDKSKEEALIKNTPSSLKKIKNLYRQLARQVHPDMNENIKDDLIVQDLWNRTCIAYNCQNLEELEELEVLINRYLNSLKHQDFDMDIPNVEEKIFNLNRRIEKILRTDPYQYKYILADEKSINRKKEELYKELNDYHRYSDELDKQIAEFDISEEIINEINAE